MHNMEYNIVIFISLLIGSLAATASPFSPRKLHCMFFAHANVTCSWEAGVKVHPDTQYTLQVNKTGWSSDQCHSFQTHCFVPVRSLNREYCIRVLAHSKFHTTVGSDTLCLIALHAAKLPPPEGLWLFPKRGQPKCLRLRWSASDSFPVPKENIQNGSLLYQLQYTTPDQPVPHTLDVDLREEVSLCVFSPCTKYRVRIRYRYNHVLSPWSEWSYSAEESTEAEAPSIIPQLWRTMHTADAAGFRRVTLLWKVAQQTGASCTDLWYTVQCKTKNSSAVLDKGDCNDLGPANRSCHLTLPPHTCVCTLGVSNYAGPSPLSSITIASQRESEPRSLAKVRVIPLDDSRLEIQWAALEYPTLTSFVIEWCITEDGIRCQSEIWWQRVDKNTHKTIITEGVEPKLCYTVRVRAEYGTRAGPGLTVLAYSRQNAPSVGPKLHVAELGCSYVVLHWSPVPLALRNGFITNYTLHYQSVDNFTRELPLSADHEQYILTGVSGQFRIYMKAYTQAGRGPAGPDLSVFIESCTSMLMIILSGCLLTVGFAVLLCLCYRMRQRIKKNIWPKVPNPAHSSLSEWLY